MEIVLMSDLAISFSAAWIGICLGCVAGAVQGLFFHNETWLGGYDSWQRRMLRLGHISLIAIGFINLGFALTAATLGLAGTRTPAVLLVVAAATMPLVCYLSAIYKPFRHLFFIPALSLTAASGLTAFTVVFR
jgi:hypothetical protein